MRFTRRSVLGGIGLMGLTPAHALAATSVGIPPGPMTLRRRIERELHDGEKIIVTRWWVIEFARQGRGIAMTGKQIEAEVSAPDKLAALARIEQERSTEDMWPILLDSDGKIAAAGSNIGASDLDAAIKEAEKLIASSTAPLAEINAKREYLQRVQGASTSLIELLPSDLFFPSGGVETIKREVALSDNLTGEFEVTYTTATSEHGPWMASAKREIVTRIEDEETSSIDFWEMAKS